MKRGGRLLTAGLVCAALAAAGIVVAGSDHMQALAGYVLGKVRGGYMLEERLSGLDAPVQARLRPAFTAAGLPYPPAEVAYVAIKDARRLEVYGRTAATDPWRHVRDYEVQGLSGTLGPKLAEGDRQVPEGIYRAEYLNPNSRYHLSIRLDYPNAFDRRMAAADGRTRLGGDIMIHGTDSSIGCLAVGNRAAEDLFVLAALVGKERVRIVVSPVDFRTGAEAPAPAGPRWIGDLHRQIREELARYRRVTAGADGSPGAESTVSTASAGQ